MSIDNDQDLAVPSEETTEAAQETTSVVEAATTETQAAQPKDAVEAVEKTVTEAVDPVPEAVDPVPEATEEPGTDAPEETQESASSPEVSVEDDESPSKDDTPTEFPTPRGERPAISAPKQIADVPDDLSADDFAAAIEQTVFEFKEGDIVAGTVVRVDPDEVLVDIGYKSEGVIPPHELSVRNSVDPADVVSVGDEIEALVLQKEDDEGRLVLSKKRAQYERAWNRRGTRHRGRQGRTHRRYRSEGLSPCVTCRSPQGEGSTTIRWSNDRGKGHRA
jgi:predicted RNA-binding protein with RPS1 domain